MKAFIKKIVPPHSLPYKLAQKCYQWSRLYWKFDVLESYVNYKKDISFIQIGSNDGMHGDPLRNWIKEKGWKGFLVEPVPYLFEQLKKNYAGLENNLQFENSAIAHENGKLSFFRLQKSDLPDLPPWYDQLGSFKREVVIKHRDSVPHFDELFIEDTVNAITFEKLLEKYSIKNVDLLHIDTEGYDYEIVRMIPYRSIQIDLIMYEHKHLNDTDYKKAIRILKRNGYKVRRKDRTDMIAVNKKILNLLRE